MSRGWIGPAIAAVVVAGVGAALALGLFGGDGETATDDPSIPMTLAIVTTSTVEPEMTTAQTSPTTMTASGEDALCAAIDEMTADLDGHLPVEGPEDLEAVRSASVSFYTGAVALVGASEKESFEEVRAYEEALFEWSEANEWEPTRSLEDLTDDPPPVPPAGAFAVVTQVFEERCGVVPLRE